MELSFDGPSQMHVIAPEFLWISVHLISACIQDLVQILRDSHPIAIFPVISIQVK